MRMRYLALTGIAFLSAAAPAAAQAATPLDPISGSWSGDMGLNLSERHPVRFELKFDGSALSGHVVGPVPIDFKTGSFDQRTGSLRLEVEVKDDAAPRIIVFDGTAIAGMATGRVTDGARTGSFRILREGNAATTGAPSDSVYLALRGGFAEVSAWVSKSADLVPAEKYAFQPVKTVRTFGQLLAHVADSYNYYCARAAGRNVEWSDAIEKGNTGKATVVPKLKQALEACNAAYAGSPALGPALGNVAHTSLHYGNIITYLRVMGLVPPSS